MRYGIALMLRGNRIAPRGRERVEGISFCAPELVSERNSGIYFKYVQFTES